MSRRKSLVTTSIVNGRSLIGVFVFVPPRLFVALYPVSLVVETVNGESTSVSLSIESVAAVLDVGGTVWAKAPDKPAATGARAASRRSTARGSSNGFI